MPYAHRVVGQLDDLIVGGKLHVVGRHEQRWLAPRVLGRKRRVLAPRREQSRHGNRHTDDTHIAPPNSTAGAAR
jgi:hypothetical protein